MSQSNLSRRPVHRVTWILVLLLGFAAAAAAQPPTVNGLFHGDGDNALYAPYATSNGGSVLYSYYHAPTTTLYVALVVNHAVNDLVCSPKSNTAYTGSATPSWGGHRSCKRASDSEFATFTFECAPGSPKSWTWQQGLACPLNGANPPSNWVTSPACPSSAGTWPPSINAASSFVTNVNTYQNAVTPRGWNLYALGTDLDGGWKSPFVAGSPNDVTAVPGYPTYSGSNFEWEWSMVYEWSIDIGPSGPINCGNQTIFFVTGLSHHSPPKSGPENDPFPPPTGDSTASDWGDLPSSYNTLQSTGGARHYLKVSSPYLGQAIQFEQDGRPSADAGAEGGEEDGVVANVTSNWTPGATRTITVNVANAPSGALLGGWFDWNGDGDVADAGEFFSWNVVEGANVLNVTVGAGFNWQTNTLYARFRLFSSGATAPGGSLNQADFAGTATDGEVEDYRYQPGSLPVTLSAFTSERSPNGELTVRWQTASETDNVAFELWGQVAGTWQVLTDLIATQSGSSGLAQTYEARIAAPLGLTALQLVDYDIRGRLERFGAFSVGERFGDFERARPIDWSGPRAAREERLRDLGFVDTAGSAGTPAAKAAWRGADLADAASAERWKKLRQGEPVAGMATRSHGASAVTVATRRSSSRGGPGGGGAVAVASGPLTHVAVTAPGIQRVTYEALRDGGLDLAGVDARSIAVTWRGQPVERWIGDKGDFGPGGAIEFLGRPPAGDDALYIDANLYQVVVDRALAKSPATGQGKAKSVSPSYQRETWVDRPGLYHHQSPTGDPWVERTVLVRGGQPTAVTLDLPVAGPVLAGASRLSVGLGSITDLADLRDAAGRVIPEHNVEVWVRGPSSGFVHVATASTSGQSDWKIEATIPAGILAAGLNQVELRFATDYFFSLVVVDRYGVRYPSPYRGPSLDFVPDPGASGYLIDGFASPAVATYAEGTDGALTRLDARVNPSGAGYAVELRQLNAERFWVTAAPHAPAVFTTAATPDLLSGPADLVVIAGSSFVGTQALDDYVAARAAFRPVVVDVEDVFNAVGYGMALPSAITDYLAARNAIYPFSQVQLVGTDCYDRLNRVSQCLSYVPLPSARVGASIYTPSQNRLLDLDGDRIADKAVGQFSVRDESELATIVRKGATWEASGLPAGESALLIAEETDGTHDFRAQIERLEDRLGWSGTEVLRLADHPDVQTARAAMTSSLDAGRAVTVFSGHSSPTVWSLRGLLTASSAAALTNSARPTIMVPLACETTYDISPNANVLGHQLLFAGDQGAVAISGAVALSSLHDNERMAEHVLAGLEAGLSLGEAVQAGRRALGTANQELQDNWITQGDVAIGMDR